MRNPKHKSFSISTESTKKIAEAKAKLDPNSELQDVNDRDVRKETELLSLGIRPDTGRQVVRESNKDIKLRSQNDSVDLAKYMTGGGYAVDTAKLATKKLFG